MIQCNDTMRRNNTIIQNDTSNDTMRQYDTMHLHNDIQQEPCSQISVRAFMFPAVIMVTVSPVFFLLLLCDIAPHFFF